MTFVEFAERLVEQPIVLIPLGSQEEQGPHAPMGDFILTEVIAARVAEATGAVAAPTLPFGYADYFRTIPGGIAFRPETFKAALEDILTSFLEHGLTRLVILNGHSGNYPLIEQVIRGVKRSWSALVPCLNLWRLVTSEVWQEVHGAFGARALGHGGDPITSVYLHLFPELTRMDLAAPARPTGRMLGLPTLGLNGVSFRGIEVGLAVDVTDHCADGIAGGDPTRSSAEIGKRITDHIVDICADFVRHLAALDPKTTEGEP